MNKLTVFILIVFLPATISAQQHVHKNIKTFFPYFTVNYNLHNIQYTEYNNDQSKLQNSMFFGFEFGFSIFPKNKSGLFFDYSNKLIGELGVREIYKLFNNENSNNITDNTISSGFFGSFDIGKQINSDENSQFIAGIHLSDKYISGINLMSDLTNAENIEYNGFHLSPGIYGEYKRKLNKSFSFSGKLELSQSVLNFWKFAENGDSFDFRHPIFTELNANLRHKSGIYIITGTTVMIPYSEIKPSYRLSFGFGFRF